jgi:hypothetical protein
MSRCYSCQVILTTEEMKQRFKTSGDYTEMCNKCIRATGLESELMTSNMIEDDDELTELVYDDFWEEADIEFDQDDFVSTDQMWGDGDGYLQEDF